MLLFSSALFKHKLTFVKLVDCMEHLMLAATWVEGEWGYIRNKGIEYRQEMLTGLNNQTYIAMLNHQPVGMFVLHDYEYHPELRERAEHLPTLSELMCVYVDKDYRGLGFGYQIIDKAKQVAREAGSDLILLDTLKPGLNRMYEKQGGEVICESQLYSHPTELLTMRL